LKKIEYYSTLFNFLYEPNTPVLGYSTINGRWPGAKERGELEGRVTTLINEVLKAGGHVHF
jgi:hypothetical protein